jgi:hypothetical protein
MTIGKLVIKSIEIDALGQLGMGSSKKVNHMANGV